MNSWFDDDLQASKTAGGCGGYYRRRNKLILHTRKRDAVDSKEGESYLFLRQYCMSSGSPFYHFAACNMYSIPVTHSTSILGSFCLQCHSPTICYPHVLYSFFMNFLPAFALVYEWVNGANPTSLQICMYFLSSGLPSSPAHRVWPKGSPLWDSQPPSVLTASMLPKVWPQEIYPSSKSICDRSITKTRVQQTHAVFLELSVSYSANLSDHVWFAARMLT